MARTIVVALPPALVVAWCWLRLERPRDLASAAALLALALLPALAPGRWRRLLAALAAAVVAVPVVALDQRLDRHLDFLGAAADQFARGFGEFYDVALPFDASRPAMEGVLLVAVFCFVLVLALAVAERRAALAVAVLLVGAGWPATLLAGGELARGTAILAAALWLLAGLGTTRSAGRPLAAGAFVLAVAAVVSSSTGVARGGLLDWQSWKLHGDRPPAVSVAYVWRSSYSGLDWPVRETTVLRVQAPAQSFYWKATTLDVYADGHWLEQTTPIPDPLDDPLLPTRGRDETNWLFTKVEVVGLRDTHLPAAGTPLFVHAGQPIGFDSGGARSSGLGRGESYAVSSYAPSPTPRQLVRAGTEYPSAAARYRVADRTGVNAPLYRRALAVTTRARTPYGEALALESWFRSGGGFRYDEHPPPAHGPALVDFVLRTKAGYCQHFAGAMTLMLRLLGVPARVAVGFTSGTYDAGKREWTVTDHDAHAWVEAWFPGWGWIPFDPTPGRGELEGSYTSASPTFDAAAAASAVGSSLAQRAGAHPELIGERPASRGGGRIELRHGGNGRLRVLLALAALALLAAGFAAAKLGARRLAVARARDARAWARAARGELAAYAADQGVELPEGSTLDELVPLVRARFGVDAGPFARAATAAAYAAPARADRAADAARRELRALRRALRAELPLARRLRGALSTRSL